MKNQWVKSRYSTARRGRYELAVGELQVFIFQGRKPAYSWKLSCDKLAIYSHRLQALELEDVKSEALEVVLHKLSQYASRLEDEYDMALKRINRGGM